MDDAGVSLVAAEADLERAFLSGDAAPDSFSQGPGFLPRTDQFISIGDRVVLDDDFAVHADAAGGPLRPGLVGIVRVLREGGRANVDHRGTTWWYDRPALRCIQPYEVGNLVRLVDATVDDAATGPMPIGHYGRVCELDCSDITRCRVDYRGQRWWYQSSALELKANLPTGHSTAELGTGARGHMLAGNDLGGGGRRANSQFGRLSMFTLLKRVFSDLGVLAKMAEREALLGRLDGHSGVIPGLQIDHLSDVLLAESFGWRRGRRARDEVGRKEQLTYEGTGSVATGSTRPHSSDAAVAAHRWVGGKLMIGHLLRQCKDEWDFLQRLRLCGSVSRHLASSQPGGMEILLPVPPITVGSGKRQLPMRRSHDLDSSLQGALGGVAAFAFATQVEGLCARRPEEARRLLRHVIGGLVGDDEAMGGSAPIRFDPEPP